MPFKWVYDPDDKTTHKYLTNYKKITPNPYFAYAHLSPYGEQQNV